MFDFFEIMFVVDSGLNEKTEETQTDGYELLLLIRLPFFC